MNSLRLTTSIAGVVGAVGLLLVGQSVQWGWILTIPAMVVILYASTKE